MESFGYILFVSLDVFFFIIFTICTIYLFFFSLYSKKKNRKEYPKAEHFHRFAVLFPAYREDAVIRNSIERFLEQNYPSEFYKVIVISDKMEIFTVDSLRQIGATVLEVNFEKSSKARALKFAMDRLQPENYDIVVILDADNHVQNNFLQKLNDAYASGVRAVQAHRTAKNRNSEIAFLDSVSEEINNSIFRKGHVNAGLSSALSGSGMAFEFDWFKQTIYQIHSIGEDKELEMFLLQDKIHIEYLDDVVVWDEKVQKTTDFSQQRQRWLGAQFTVLLMGFHFFSQAIKEKNIDYCDKLLQWMMPPRLILVGWGIMAIFLVAFVHFTAVYKWIFMYILLSLSIRIAMPRGFSDLKYIYAIRLLPLLFFRMIFSFFRIKKNKEKFIHTPHGKGGMKN